MLTADNSLVAPSGDTLRATSLAYVEVDRRGLIREWNPAAQRLFGWTRDEMVGRPLADTLVPGTLRSTHSAAFARRLASDEPWTGMRVEVPASHRDGAELRVTMVLDPLPDGFCAFLSDQTDWHQAQQELQRSTTLVNAILEHTSAMISAKDLDGCYLFVNGEYERVFQVDAAELVGHRDTDVLPEVVAASGRAHDRHVISTGEALTALEELPFGDQIRQYVVTRFPLIDPDGSIYGVCSIAIDDTARRRSEDQLGESERLFRATVNNAPGMLFQLRFAPDGGQAFTFVSDGCRDIYGLEPNEIITDPRLVLDTVEDDGMHVSLITLEPWRWQGVVVRPDGERRRLQGAGRFYRLTDGTTLCDGVVLDRTEEHTTEGRRDLDELTRRLARYRFTAVAGPLGDPLLTSSTGDAAAVLGAADPADGLLAAFRSVTGEADHERLRAAFATALGGEPADFEAGRLWLRLRPERLGGRQVIEGACFELGAS
ncbi:PAS domain-containing protein [Actinoplanes sp. TRM 88003]|uniref:PAS domain-containing protein n=1 Tax=Paractinoplanes aksuensis TaxID=2939490 RepID=A0ABT1DX77_9ACTN|nr:PAS domain-containing protein [Actinoplanes aksuensis]MCO8275423.1 PAS domain-containing protein [Actinoplanes aksuensis]